MNKTIVTNKGVNFRVCIYRSHYKRGNMSRRRKTLNSVKLPLKIDLVSYPTRAEGLVNMYKRKIKKMLDHVDNWPNIVHRAEYKFVFYGN